MTDSNSIRPISKSDTSVPIIEVPATIPPDLSSPVILELVKQGGMITALFLICVFVYLLTKLIKASKED